MAYCPECGSEVAQHDTFCAYCGIALPAVSEPESVEIEPTEFSPTSDLNNGVAPVESIQNEELKAQAATAEAKVESDSLLENSIPATPAILEEEIVAEKTEIVEIAADNELVIEQVEVAQTNAVDQTSLHPTEEIAENIEEIPRIGSESAELAPNENYIENNQELLANINVDSEKIEDVDFIEPSTKEDSALQVPRAEIEIPVGENAAPQIEIKTDYNEVPITGFVSENQFNEATPIPVIEQEEVSPQIVNELEVGFEKNLSDEVLDEPKTNLTDVNPNLVVNNEEDKLLSVLDEIDLNFQNNLPEQKSNEPIQEEGVVIPTAANLQQEVFPFQNQAASSPFVVEASFEGKQSDFSTEAESIPTIISEPVAESVIEETTEKTPEFTPISVPFDEALEEKVEFSEEKTLIAPFVEPNFSKNIENQVATEAEKSEEKEGRAYTNPNIGVGDTDGRNKTKLKPLEEGTVLNNRYEIVRKIGGGGMGAVYLASDKNLGGVLRAVKEMVQSYIEDDQQEKAVNDFKRESLLLTSLEHTGIPTIYDYFFDEKEARFYLVMKYISGGDLAARLRATPEGRIDEVSVTDWAIQITDVLDYLHNRQPPIVYRDLKPSNIMIDGNTGKVMIIDFGIARWVNKEEKGVTAVGTMGYAPPELFSGNVEPRSDIYSLGSTMFHLLTGADPQSNPLLIFDFNKNPRPRQINPQLSDQMEQILMRSVEYNSGQRFKDALEMRDELLKHLENLRKGTVTFGVMTASAGSPITSNVPVFCGFCGQKIVATDMFCPFCGAQQPLAEQSRKLGHSPVYAAPSLLARLMIAGTNELERTEYILEKDNNLLGRRDPMSNIFPEVDLSKFDPQTKISRKHARIWREGDVFMLEDLGSSNGTVLISTANDSVRLLPRQPHVLAHGDKVKLGDTTLRFTIG